MARWLLPSRAGAPIAVLAAAILLIGAATDASARRRPVKLADQRFVVAGAPGSGLVPVQASLPLDAPAPDIRRVLITLHGVRRNARAYFDAAREAAVAAGEAGRGTLVVAPQFLTKRDAKVRGLPPDTLVFTLNGWREGYPALAPAPLSADDVLDALIAHFADRLRYPHLTEIVLVGHSAGAQLLQRYAAVGRGEGALRQAGIGVRYVVANPSSYLYFSPERPGAGGTFQAADAASCPNVDRWPYGLAGAPPYVAAQEASKLEARYVARDVTYLLGMDDTNPQHRLLDRSCAGEAQGPDRLARGLSYYAYLRARDGAALRHRVVEVPNVGHAARRMYSSPCGLAVLFGSELPGSCPHQP